MVWIDVVKTGRIAAGTMNHILALCTELCVVNDNGTFSVFGDR